MSFILPLSNHTITLWNRATPGTGARNRNPQKREEPCWKPVQNPSAEKWNHGWNVSAEGKRLAAVSGAMTADQHFFISFWRIICHFTNININELYCFSIIQSNISGLKSCVFGSVEDVLTIVQRVVSAASQEINQGGVGATQQREYAYWGGRKSCRSWGAG